MATYTPDGGTDLAFGLLIDPPTRQTQQTMSERVIPGSNTSVVDRIGKTVTKIRGQAKFDSFDALKTFEGAIGSTGTLVYSEEPGGLPVIFVSLERSRVTPSDIHLGSVEFWIIPSSDGTLVAPRLVSVSATAVGPVSGTVSLTNILTARVSYGFDLRTGECRLTLPVKPACTYDDVLSVTLGAGNNIERFEGLIRDFLYQDGATTVTVVARGYLQRAIEYENGEESTYGSWIGAGGLLLPDLVGSITGSSADIVKAVLDRAEVPYDAANIGGSSVVYGTGQNPPAFLWRSGSTGVNQPLEPADTGESAMSYIERYDMIDAQISGASTGGRYRTFETLGGQVFRLRVGGRPQSTPDVPPLTEGVDILSGNFTRSISQTRNYFVVKGMDQGRGFGPLAFGLQESNDFQPSTSKHTYSLSSDMIERADNTDTWPYQNPDGMSCETLANALALEYNRETVSGWVETWRDDAFGIAQTHLVQGGPGGTVGALGIAEPVWVQSLEISIDNRGFTQRLTYLGGGLPDDGADLDVMRQAIAVAAS